MKDFIYMLRRSNLNRRLFVVTRSLADPKTQHITETEVLAVSAEGPVWLPLLAVIKVVEDVTGWQDPKVAASILVAVLTEFGE